MDIVHLEVDNICTCIGKLWKCFREWLFDRYW